MAAKIIPLPVAGNRAWHNPDSLFLESAPFSSMCPLCKDSRSQLTYSARALARRLHRNQPIEAHCAICDQLWPINAEERTRLADELALLHPKN